MWPWEHAAIGYIGYSVLCRLRGRLPAAGPTLSLLVGTQLPDLIDKPLAWWLGVLPAGRSLGHSILFAVPVCLAVVFLSRRVGRGEYGLAFTVGYLLHLPADVISPVLFGGPPSTNFLLWPLRPVRGGSGWEFGCELGVASLIECLFGPLGVFYLLGELVLLGTALYLWHRDGYPGFPRMTSAREKR